MKKCICNRCGNKFRSKDRGVSAIKINVNDPYSFAWTIESLDLCYNCTNEFEKFLNLKRKDNLKQLVDDVEKELES